MKILHKQSWHILFLIILLLGINFVIKYDNQVLFGNLWGVKTHSWLYLTIFFAIVHQAYVLICWRYELFYKGLSKILKKTLLKFIKLVLQFLYF